MVAPARPKTFDELYAVIRELPEGERGEILIEGSLHITMGRPGKKHRRAAQSLYAARRGVGHRGPAVHRWIDGGGRVGAAGHDDEARARALLIRRVRLVRAVGTRRTGA
jgi:hypothetical protein